MKNKPEEPPYSGEGRTIEEAADDAAKKIPSTLRHEWFLLEIYAEASGEHNPIHGYRVVLGSGG
jgi:hypothetical protein